VCRAAFYEVCTVSKRFAQLFLAIIASALPARAGDPPNILFIMTDDHGAQALSCYGSNRNQTLQLDRLANEGMRFSNCFVTNSICTPSRATLLTGKYSHKNGTPVFNRFDGSQQTAPKLLQAAGYYTAIVGKWHLGSDPTGFDDWLILPGQGVYNDPTLYDRNGPRTFTGYATDIITDLTIALLKNRPKKKPFFVMCHHKAPHREWTPDAKNREKFAGRTIDEPQTLRDDYGTRPAALPENAQTVANDLTRRDLKLVPPVELQGPDRAKWLNTKPNEVEIEIDGVKKTLTGDELRKWKYQRYMQDYLACVQGVDDNVGRLLDWIDANGLRENTVVIYTSDNGFFLGEHGLYDKRFMYEESLRIPFHVSWPGVSNEASTESAMAINPDFAPTLLEIAGLPVPAEMQGRSLVSLLRGERPPDWRTSMYYRYYHDPGHHNTRAHYGVRTETHKLIYYWKKNQWELFDLTQDPNELRNVYEDTDQREIVEKLKAELARLKRAFGDDDQFANKLPPDGVDAPMPWLKAAKPGAPNGADKKVRQRRGAAAAGEPGR
jgi:arylsulfatase A-like enzyme